MIPSQIRYVMVCLALAACGDQAPRTARLSEALPNLPLPPRPSFVSRAGGPDALQVTVRSPTSADSVATYYRQVFKRGNWRLVNDAKDAEGATVLFAKQNGPPLWVRIREAEDGPGSLVELSGAVVPRSEQGAAVKKPAGGDSGAVSKPSS
jgi:hypothetical protein